jgi:hypothetical protein
MHIDWHTLLDWRVDGTAAYFWGLASIPFAWVTTKRAERELAKLPEMMFQNQVAQSVFKGRGSWSKDDYFDTLIWNRFMMLRFQQFLMLFVSAPVILLLVMWAKSNLPLDVPPASYLFSWPFWIYPALCVAAILMVAYNWRNTKQILITVFEMAQADQVELAQRLNAR